MGDGVGIAVVGVVSSPAARGTRGRVPTEQAMTRRYGIILPHFGSAASPATIVGGAVRAEELGFDSVWLRDHLVYLPHPYEGPDRTFIEPFSALSAIASRTSRIVLGTAILTLYRHPVHSALQMTSLDFLAGGGRVITGWGLGGGWEGQMPLVGLGDVPRGQLLRENLAIIRGVLAGDEVEYRGEIYDVPGVSLRPVPSTPIPLYVGGSGPVSVRRAVAYGDGWLPSRLPRWRFLQLARELDQQAVTAGRGPVPIAMPVFVSPGATVDEGATALDLPNLFGRYQRQHGPGPSGRYESIDDLDLAALAGPPERLVAGLEAWHEAGLDHIILDLRARHDDFLEVLELLGAEVLPALRQEPGELTSPGS